MKIAIDARSLCQKQRGIPVYVFQILTLMPKALPDAEIFAFINTAFEHNEPENNYLSRLEAVSNSGVTLVDIQCETEIKWEQYLLPRKLSLLNIKLLHMPANRICLKSPCTQLTTIHDAIEWTELKGPRLTSVFTNPKLYLYNMRAHFYVWLQYKCGLKLVDHILTISKYSQTDIVKNFPQSKDKISFVHHGLPNLFSDLGLPQPKDTRDYILMLGGASHHKNPYKMMLAYSKLPLNIREDYKLKIVGINPETMSLFQNWAEKLNITQSVDLYSWINEQTLLQAFQHAYLFLFASVEEGFGFPIIQSMSCGTPIVTSTADVIMELTQSKFFSAPHDDENGLRDGMLRLLESEQEWQSQSCQVIEMSKKFKWKYSIQHIAALYTTLLNR